MFTIEYTDGRKIPVRATSAAEARRLGYRIDPRHGILAVTPA